MPEDDRSERDAARQPDEAQPDIAEEIGVIIR